MEGAGVELASKVDRISYTRKTGWGMPHQLWLMKNLPRLFQTKQESKILQDGYQSCAQQKPHDTKNGEDTKGALHALFLCTIKRVVFIVDFSNR